MIIGYMHKIMTCIKYAISWTLIIIIIKFNIAKYATI